MANTKSIVLLGLFLAVFSTSARSEEDSRNQHLSLVPMYNAINYGGTQTTNLKLGLDYEFRFAFDSRQWGLGLMIDASLKQPMHEDFALTLNHHPYEGLRVILAGGARRAAFETWALGRLGLGYDFDVMDHFTVTPMAMAELVDQHRFGYLAGLGLGCNF